jgi:methionyl-tRNA formyltransferase
MDEGIDTGPVIASRAWPLDHVVRAPSLEAKAAAEGAVLLEATIPAWLDGLLTATAQGNAGASVTTPFRREDGRLDPGRGAAELERQVRANEPWPGTFIETDLGRVAVLAADVADARPGDVVGQLVEHDGRLALATSAGRLVIDSARREGRRDADGREFLRGQRQLVGTAVT